MDGNTLIGSLRLGSYMGVVKINVIFKFFSASNSNQIVFHTDAQLKHATSYRSQLYITWLCIIPFKLHSIYIPTWSLLASLLFVF